MSPARPASPTASAAVAAAAILWLGLLIVSPYLVSTTSKGRALFDAGGLVYLAGHVVCHQRSDRSFHAWGVQLPVCGRCFGLYAGAAVGSLLVACRRPSPSWRGRSRVVSPSSVGSGFSRIASPSSAGSAFNRSATASAQPNWLLRFSLAGAPTLASLALEMTGLWAQSPFIRCVAAVPLGLAAGWFVAASAPEVIGRAATIVSGVKRAGL